MDDERRLVERAQGGDHEAFLALLARYDRQIMSVVYRFTANACDREDLYQEIFLQCYRSLGKFRFRCSLGTWLYRVALNRALTHVRKRQPVAEPAEHAAPEVDWEQRARLDAVHGALARLGKRQRLCFHLHYVEGWGIDQIAEVLDCRPGTVKSHLNRARSNIRADREVLVWQTNP